MYVSTSSPESASWHLQCRQQWRLLDVIWQRVLNQYGDINAAVDGAVWESVPKDLPCHIYVARTVDFPGRRDRWTWKPRQYKQYCKQYANGGKPKLASAWHIHFNVKNYVSRAGKLEWDPKLVMLWLQFFSCLPAFQTLHGNHLIAERKCPSWQGTATQGRQGNKAAIIHLPPEVCAWWIVSKNGMRQGIKRGKPWWIFSACSCFMPTSAMMNVKWMSTKQEE